MLRCPSVNGRATIREGGTRCEQQVWSLSTTMPDNPDRPRVYLETTIISYLTASPIRDLIQAAHQQVTRDWWNRRDRFDLFVSEAVLEEASRGDAEAAKRRSDALSGISVPGLEERVSDLADRLLQVRAIPRKAVLDAIHIAVAALNGMDCLLTWNCTHIANAAVRGKIERACLDLGLEPPVICTPEELMEI